MVMEQNENLEHISPEEKGKLAEEKTFLALEELKKEGRIKDFGQSFFFSQEDLKGIDFIIISGEGKIIRLQVKSYFGEKEMKKYRRRGIWYLAAQLEKSLEEVKKEILEIVEKATKS